MPTEKDGTGSSVVIGERPPPAFKNGSVSTLAPETVVAMRKDAASGEYTLKGLARKYGIHKERLRKILSRERYAWIDDGLGNLVPTALATWAKRNDVELKRDLTFMVGHPELWDTPAKHIPAKAAAFARSRSALKDLDVRQDVIERVEADVLEALEELLL